MKTPLTDAATIFVVSSGHNIPVVSADLARLLETRIAALTRSQSFAWSLVRDCNWSTQSDNWKTLARCWQQDIFVQDELPLTYPPNTREGSPVTVKTMQEARAYIAKLETALRQAARHLADAEKLENDMIAKIHHLETKLNEVQLSNCAFGAN